MEFKGTKGKWEFYKTYDEEDTPQFSITSKEGTIVHCYNLQIADGVQEKTKANALLISKAPEMLEMLNFFINEFDDVFHEETEVYEKVEQTKQLIKEAIELK